MTTFVVKAKVVRNIMFILDAKDLDDAQTKMFALNDPSKGHDPVLEWSIYEEVDYQPLLLNGTSSA